MVEKKVIVIHEEGLHARPATLFVKKAMQFEAKVNVVKDGRLVNGKSLLSVLSLGASKGTEILIQVDGVDEEEGLSSLIEILSKDLD